MRQNLTRLAMAAVLACSLVAQACDDEGQQGEPIETPTSKSGTSASDESTGEPEKSYAAEISDVELDSIEKREAFLQAFCGEDVPVEDGACGKCPSYTTEAGEDGEGLEPSSTVRVSVDEGPTFLLASVQDCEPEAGGNRHTAVIEKTSEGWKRTDSTAGHAMNDCRAVEIDAVPAMFLCRGADMGQGVLYSMLTALRVTEAGEIETQQLLRTVKMGGNPCRDVYESEGIVGRTYDSGTRTVTVNVRALHVRVPEDDDVEFCDDLKEKYELPDPESIRLDYEFRDGAFQLPDRVDGDDYRLTNVQVRQAPTEK